MITCPHCGGEFFYRTSPVWGTWLELVKIRDDKTIELVESTTDRIIHGDESKTLQCGDCKKRIPNPKYEHH